MLCKKCNKRMAVVFVSRMEKDGQVNEGYCLKCAKDLGIQQVDQIIKNMGLTDEDLDAMSEEMETLNQQLGLFPENMDGQSAPAFPPMGMFAPKKDAESPKDKKGNKQEQKKRKFLEQYATNLNRKATEGKLDPVIGRKMEIDRMLRILNRRTKNNPVLIGEPGVGKTAVANALAQKIVAGDVPAKLLDKEVYLLDLTALVAGTQFRGQFESRIKGLISEVVELGNIILVIDEVHNLVGTGEGEGSMNAANILKPALANGEIQVIGATTLAEYRKYIEKDAALERRFQPIIVNEPGIEETVEILKGLRDVYGAYHHVHISDALLTQAAVMSERYITERFLPDKAIDLIDEASSGAAIENVTQNQKLKIQFELAAVRRKLDTLDTEDEQKMFEESARLKSEQCRLEQQLAEYKDVPEVTELTFDHIAYVLELWTGIPATKIKQQEFDKLNTLRDRLRERIIGQDAAIDALCAAIKRRRVGIGYNHSPISFIFTGPTGVGKTELVKQLSLQLFDSTEALIRVDMSEYMEKHSVSKLIGAPPGYVGYDDAGQLTEKIRRKPYSVVLFDEIEKAHPDVLNIMLQMLDDGKLTDAQGRHINFENTIIVMTTNASAGMMNTTGFNRNTEQLEKEKATKALLTFLRPEFVNRVDEIIPFAALSRDTVRNIATIMLGDLQKGLSDRDIVLEYNDAVVDYLAEKGFDAKFGARSLKRTIQKELEDQAAELIISHFDTAIHTMRAEITEGKLIVTIVK
ncbi:MAG: ATP-dependent Clp protease ATP-binding subunit [Clostridia bacterium]|nr:ATP-dependent Clp protease ATP-binding subunit [Clostridia bacterium]